MYQYGHQKQKIPGFKDGTNLCQTIKSEFIFKFQALFARRLQKFNGHQCM